MKKEETAQPQNWKQNLVLYLHDCLYLIVVVWLLFLLLFRVIVVTGPSMYNTLYDGDYLLLLSNAIYQEPKAGDIVVIKKHDYDTIVKRVIALEGQRVDIDFTNGIVYVDGEALEENYIHNLTTNSEGVNFPLTVAPGCIFVLGDNRNMSKDSRSPDIAQIDRREVLGKAILRIFPGTHYGQHPLNFSRIGVIQDGTR